jgi:hypothetical protein
LEAHKTVLLEEVDESVPTLFRVFGAPVDVDAPSTPFAFGPEIDGADLDLRGRGLGEMNAEGFQACPGVGEGQCALGLTRWGQFEGVGWGEINFVVNHARRPLFD